MTSPFNKTNKFDLTHEVLSTFEMGKLYPNMLMEVVPGDTFDVRTESFSRFESMIAPQMGRIDKFQYYFYVPHRILFGDWEKYITGGFDGQDTTVKPYMTSPSGGYAVGSLADYLGIPTGVAGLNHSALPFRAYQKIYMDWFADENLMTITDPSTASGADTTTNTSLYNKCWEKDYFTNSLPTPQRGQAAYLPLGTAAPVVLSDSGKKLYFEFGDRPGASGSSIMAMREDGNTKYSEVYQVKGTHEDSTMNSAGYVLSDLKADLSNATAATINQIRVAFQIQRFMEKNMRGGARLVEWTLSHFGVRIPDGRLQRSEFLGGSRAPVVVSAVEQNSATVSGQTPQGNLAGRGVSAGKITGFRKSFVEQGYIIGLVCYLPRTMYSQGLARHWSRSTRYEEYIPVFAHLGEQEVKNKEIYAQGTSADEDTFGYQDRYNELRHQPSTVHGLFRPGQSLNYWTLGRQFNSLPSLNSTFVTSDPSNRIFAVQSATDHIEAQFLHHVKALRPLPKFGNPGLIDHE